MDSVKFVDLIVSLMMNHHDLKFIRPLNLCGLCMHTAYGLSVIALRSTNIVITVNHKSFHYMF